MIKVKKACKGTLYPKSSSVSSRLKKGGSFPDLNKDGKITKADILKGRGVIAKKGMKVKKAQDGTSQSVYVKNLRDMGNATKIGEGKYKSEDKNYTMKFKRGPKATDPKSLTQRRTLKGFLKGAPKAAGKVPLKKGGMVKTKKCAYGCK